MKLIKNSLFVFALFITIGVSAQGNLQFNQVILYDIVASGTQNITVPANKVWKIESVSHGYIAGSSAMSLRNSAAQPIAFFSGSTGTSYTANYPFWMPSNFSGSFANQTGYRATISIIEFNVVP